MEIIFGVVNIVLLAGIAFLLRAAVTKHLQQGATEQFRRFGMIQESVQNALQASREEMNRQLRALGDQLDARIKSLQDSNEKRLEQMQGVVDEKLQKTLETRLAQSFELVSKQLEGVQQGLGEMKNLAADAKSLRNALVNVKERGTYGEVRLEKLLADILSPGQYEANAEIGGGKRVEFAVKMPGGDEPPVLLPIDSKFPVENYNRLLDAEDKPAIDEARKALAQQMRLFAKEIHDKYIVPPVTTDFALMFLPTEGLYAEAVQNAALFEELRTRYKVTPVGVTTLSVILSTVLMGYRAYAFEQKSQDVRRTLQRVKQEFGKFGEILERAHKQIQTVDNTLGEISGPRYRAIQRSLRGVETLDDGDVPRLTEADDE
jgi:DNA recombination protein RmuC